MGPLVIVSHSLLCWYFVGLFPLIFIAQYYQGFTNHINILKESTSGFIDFSLLFAFDLITLSSCPFTFAYFGPALLLPY